MNPILSAAAIVTAIGTIGGGALYLNEVHVSSEKFDQYLEAQDTRYVLELKKDIRQIKELLRDHPDDEDLEDYLEELIWALCELRPDDRQCDEVG